MICPNCSMNMFINSWNGWRWECWNCSYIGSEATDKEIAEDTKEMEKDIKEVEDELPTEPQYISEEEFMDEFIVDDLT